MTLVVYLGHGIFHTVYGSIFIFLQISFWREVLSSQIEE